jgi:hypothetical protein
LGDDDVTDDVLQIFGVRWDSPDAQLAVKVDTPVGELCLDCFEPIEPADRGLMWPVFDHISHFTDLDSGVQRSTMETRLRPVHLECSLRTSLSHIYQQCRCHVQHASLRAEALATLAAINADRASEGNGPL